MAARLRAAGLDEAFANAVAARMSEADCRGGSDLAVARALAAELASLSGVADDVRALRDLRRPAWRRQDDHDCQDLRARARSAAGISASSPPTGFAPARWSSCAPTPRCSACRSAPRAPARISIHALIHARQPTLVDTAGRSPADGDLGDLFQVLEKRRSVRTHLVLAADTSPSAAQRLFDRYAPLRPSNVVITKIDECDSVMPLMNVVRQRQLPVSFLGTGQRVPEDLARATPAALAAALISEPAREVA